MTIVDFHNHYYPPEYIKELQAGSSEFTVTFDDNDNPVLHSPGDINIVVLGHRDIEVRQQVLDDIGVYRQVITFTAPGTVVETPDRPVVPAIFVIASLAIVANQVVINPGESLEGLSLVLIGLPVYYIWLRKRNTKD